MCAFCLYLCHACSNAGGTHTLPEECFGSWFPQVYPPLSRLNSAQRNLRPEIKSLSKSESLPVADRSWWEQQQEEELIWEEGSVPHLLQAASEPEPCDTSRSFVPQRRRLNKPVLSVLWWCTWPFWESGSGHASCSPTGPRHAKGCQESPGAVYHSPQLQACKNIAPVRVSDPCISAPPRHLKGVQSAVTPRHDQSVAVASLISLFLTKSLLCTCCSMQSGWESSCLLNLAGQGLGSHWFSNS